MLKSVALGAAILALAACGGGGGSSGGSDGAPSVSAKTSGTASKGIISGARIEARQPNGELIGTAITQEDGSYTISLGNYRGAVQLLLKPRDGAMVTCDAAMCRSTAQAGDQDHDASGAIEFGERYALDYQLRSVVDASADARNVSAHITPLTTLVAEKAGASPDQATVAAANSFVKNMLGLDANPSEVKPVDLTKPIDAGEQALRFALLSAAVEQQAQASNVETVLADLTSQFTANQVNKAKLEALSGSVADVALAVKSGNADIGGVDDAAAGARQNAENAIQEACGTEETCTPQTDLEGELATNLQKAKALVATARKVSLEALEQIDVELDQQGDGYNSDNLIAQAAAFADDINTDTLKTVQAFGEVGAVLADQIGAVALDGELLTVNLKEAARRYYDNGVDGNCDWLSGDPLAACEAAAQVERDEYLAHFTAGILAHDNGSWTVTGARFDLDGDETTIDDQVDVSLTVDMPEVIGNEDDGLGLAAGPNRLAISGNAELGENRFSVDENSALVLVLNDSFADNETSESGPNINSVGLDVNAVLENAALYFSGGIDVQVRESSRHNSINSGAPVEFITPIPEKLALDGEFSAKGSNKTLQASIVLTVDNAGQFGFYQEGFQRNDLTSFSYNSGDNTLDITHGDSDNHVQVRYSVESENPGGVWLRHYVIARCLSEVGDASCPANEWRHEYPGFHQEIEGASSQQECYDTAISNPAWWEDETGVCYTWIDADSSDIQEDVRIAFTSQIGEELLGGLEATVAGEGVYVVGPEEWWPEYIIESIVPSADSGEIAAYLHSAAMDFDAQGRYLKGTLRVATHGKLSANLPAMDVELVAKRTGYQVGDLSLALQWGDDALRIEFPYSGELSRTATLSDGEGTVMTVEFSDEDSVTGRIRKDGTTYGTLRDENGIYVISWIDNTIESLY
ncbi:MAG: hypothetical protein V7667_00555 [Alloalcanivorax venustensis]|uniref:hypothetical protein n=1 Tax=Alloalcanivorax venustensis TaxID=172371 RepID=UPI003002B9F4